MSGHNHLTRDIKGDGSCPACNDILHPAPDLTRCVWCGARAARDGRGEVHWIVRTGSAQPGCEHELLDGRT